MAQKTVSVAITLERKLLPKIKRRAERLFGHRGMSRYIRHVVAQDLKRN